MNRRIEQRNQTSCPILSSLTFQHLCMQQHLNLILGGRLERKFTSLLDVLELAYSTTTN